MKFSLKNFNKGPIIYKYGSHIDKITKYYYCHNI